MSQTKIEVADILRAAGATFLQEHRGYLSGAQLRAMNDLPACRTAALGGHVDACNACGEVQVSYNSCRNRHCPKCQGSARAKWLAARQAELLPVPYFHIVFTLPDTLAPLALQNPRVMYGILFRAASQALLELAADRKYLGAKIGLLAVLHTWGQNLMHHPHVHCVVPAGGISSDGERWIATKNNDFFLPVRVLSRVFRGKLIDMTKRAFAAGELSFHDRLAHCAQPAAFEHLLNVAVRKDWIVYAKRPFGGPEVVLKYLARYTHRVNQRLLACDGKRVTFRWKDYAAAGAQKTMTLSTDEFIRRFLLHVLPSGLVRIRHYGWMANRGRSEKLVLCRRLLGVVEQQPVEENLNTENSPSTDQPTCEPPPTAPLCPACRSGRMLRIDSMQPLPRQAVYLHRRLRTNQSATLIHRDSRPRSP
jgi:hypothetical protein